MSHDLLRTWLQLSASSWPPDHYTLLGLRPGEGATDEIEMRVLERMDMLRRYQLLHPEQVTEGMNRLAQAMNCLMDLDSRRAYDAKLNLSPPPLPKNRSTPPSMGIPVGSVIELPPPLPPSSKPTVVAESGSPSRPTVLRESSSTPAPRLEKVYTPGDEPPPINEPPITPELIEEEDEPLQLEDIEELEESFEDEESRPSKKKSKRVDPEERRPFYSELARIRRVLRIWKQLRQYLADPEKAFNRRTDTVGFMTCLSDLRALLPTVSDLVGGPDQPGNLIATLAKQSLVVEMFRSLLPSQREALAHDCRTGHFRLSERYEEIRAELFRQTAKPLLRRVWYPLLRELGRSPEWIVLGLGCAALLIALIRSLPEG